MSMESKKMTPVNYRNHLLNVVQTFSKCLLQRVHFNTNRFLSIKGCPYHNALAEATFKVVKIEFAYNEKFNTLV